MINSLARAVLFANGKAQEPSRLSLLPDDLLIAVDGGLRHLEALGLTPHLLIGDLDSVSERQVEACRAKGVEVLKFPTKKDKTDLELALDKAIELGYAQIVIAFALGGRLDHTLGNLALLSRPDLAHHSVHFDDGLSEVWLARDTLTLRTTLGDLVSLLPWNGPATGVQTQHLAYPLQGATLQSYQALGVSNVAEGREITVSLSGGMLLVVHYRNSAALKGRSQ